MLSKDQRDQLIQSTERVYTAFGSIELFKHKNLFIDGEGEVSLNDFLAKKAAFIFHINPSEKNETIYFTAHGKSYIVHLDQPTPGEFIFKISESGKIKTVSEFTGLDKCVDKIDGKELINSTGLALLCDQEFSFKRNKKNTFAVGVKVKQDKTAKKDIWIGGPEKNDLYPEHLSTLLNIRDHLAKGESLSSILIALATGAGKTYVQAVWLLVLKIAKVNSIFALPNKLIAQLKRDFNDLLPASLVKDIPILQLDNPEQNVDAVKKLQEIAQSKPGEEPGFVIASYEELLDKHYQLVQGIPDENTVISFDEQHLVMDQEVRKIKLKEVAKKKLAMFLTATPNEETYELCNRKPVAFMSSKQKAMAGHGKFPTIQLSTAKTISDKGEEVSDSISLLDRAFTAFGNVLEEQCSSPIHGLFEGFQFADQEKYYDDAHITGSDFHRLRWGYQPPLASKILTIADNVEELVNLDNFLKRSDEWGDQRPLSVKRITYNQKALEELWDNDISHVYFFNVSGRWYYSIKYDIYRCSPRTIDAAMHSGLIEKLERLPIDLEPPHQLQVEILAEIKKANFLDEELVRSKEMPVYAKGNLHSRDRVFFAFQRHKDDPDKKIANKHSEKKQKTYQAAMDQLEKRNPAFLAVRDSKTPLLEQLDNNVFSGVVDYIFRDLSGLSQLELDEQRKNNFDVIFHRLHSLLMKKGENSKKEIENYYKEKLTFSKDNPSGIDPKGAEMLAKLMARILRAYYKDNKNASAEWKKEEKEHFIENWSLVNIARIKLLKNPAIKDLYLSYVNTHRVIYLMNGKSKDETAVADDAPFAGFSGRRIRLREGGWKKNKEAKDRESDIMDVFDPRALEHHYRPDYLQDVTETMADNYFKNGLIGMYVGNKKTEGFSDLSLRVEVATTPENQDTNNDPAKLIQGLGRLRGRGEEPLYFNAAAKHVRRIFDPLRLNKDEDYYPVFFEAKRTYVKQSLKGYGRKIADEIATLMAACMNPYDHVDVDRYQEGVQLAILKVFRELYNIDNHDLSLAKKHLTIVLKHARNFLKGKQAKLVHSFKYGQLIRTVGTAVRSISQSMYRSMGSQERAKLTENEKSWKSRLTLLEGEADQAKESEREKLKLQLLYASMVSKSTYSAIQENTQLFAEMMLLFEKKTKYIEGNVISAILEKIDPTELNQAASQYFLPLVVKYIHPDKREKCLREASLYTNWHQLFAFEPDLLTAITHQKKSPAETASSALKLLQRVPSLRYFLSEEDKYEFSPDPEGLANFFQEKLENLSLPLDPADMNQLKLEVMDKLRDVMDDRDLIILSRLLNKNDNFKKFLIELISEAAVSDEFEIDDLRRVLGEVLDSDPDYKKMNLNADGEIQFLPDLLSQGGSAFEEFMENFHQIYSDFSPEEKESFFQSQLSSLLHLDALHKAIKGSAAHLDRADMERFVSLLKEQATMGESKLLSGDDLEAYPGDLIEDCLRFLALVEKRDEEAIYREFLKDDMSASLDSIMEGLESNASPKFAKPRLMTLFIIFWELNNEQINCHKYFSGLSDVERDASSENVFHLYQSMNRNSRNSTASLTQMYPEDLHTMRVHFGIYDAHAMASAVPFSAGAAAQRNQKLNDLFSLTSEGILTPMLDAMEEPFPQAKYDAPPAVVHSAIGMGRRISYQSEMKASDIDDGSRFVDAIDPLIKSITQPEQVSPLAGWWLKKSTSYHVINAYNRSSEFKGLDHFVMYHCADSNDSLMKGYALATDFLRRSSNIAFSIDYVLVRNLRREVYSQMCMNTAPQIRLNGQDPYQDALNQITVLIKRMAETRQENKTEKKDWDKIKLTSSTINKIRDILLDPNDKRDSLQKLLQIQFLARDYHTNFLRKAKRRVSHFFSEKKFNEGKVVAEFCTILGKASFCDLTGSSNVADVLKQVGVKLEDLTSHAHDLMVVPSQKPSGP